MKPYFQTTPWLIYRRQLGFLNLFHPEIRAHTLLGEYVLPIQFDVAVFFENNAAALARFFADNPLYWQKQKDRIRSYWHCYHSRRYPDWQSYPVRLLAEKIDKEIARIVFRRPPTPNVV